MQPKIIKHPEITITLKKDFYGVFDKNIKELFKETGISYFAHQLIENYRMPNHKVSSFYTNENWQEIYWNNFWNNDPIEKIAHQNAGKNGISLTSWQICDPTSECMEARISTCNVRDGLFMAFSHPSGIIENYTFAWEKFDFSLIDHKTISKLQNFIMPIRQAHHQSFTNKELD